MNDGEEETEAGAPKETGTNPLDSPDAHRLVQTAYRQSLVMARELNDPDFLEEMDAEDWERYATEIGASVRALDLLLKAGAPFPHEWVVGITLP